MTREQKYVEQLRALGIYNTAFDPEIHTLAIMERDHQRTLKAWRAKGSDVTSDLYPVIERQRKDILAHRDALGLTPKALRRVKGTGTSEGTNEDPLPGTILSIVRDKYGT